MLPSLRRARGLVYAQDAPHVSISIGEATLPQGGSTYLFGTFQNLPKNPNDDGKFHPELRYRFDLDRHSEGTWSDANDCESDNFGNYKGIDTYWRDRLNIEVGAHNGLAIGSNCPVGRYRIRLAAKLTSSNTDLDTDTREYTVIAGPSVEIDLSSTSIMRGVQTDVTLRFSHLNNIQDDPTLSYRADIMRLISANSRNYANECEGTGIGNIDKSNDASNGYSDSISGSLDYQDGDGTVEISGQIAATCSTGRYELQVSLWDASNYDLTTKKIEFVVSTDAGATPSVRVSMSEDSPVTPGTEFDVIFNFYDLQDNTAIRYLDTLTNTGTNQPVGGMDCGGSLVGWGQDASATVSRNPIVHRITITSDCPEGSYRLKSAIQDNSGNEIISGSIDFDIGDPDLTPTAPSVLNYPAKQNSPFSEQLPLGSGGDGTLSYGATGMPVGLNFNISTRTIAGTPTGHGTSTVTYTVTDSDGDSDSVDFTITVAPDLTPTAPSVSNLTATQNAPFSQQMPIGSGGDGTLSYAATPLPAGLSFDDLSRTIAGTPTGNGPTTVRYTVTDSDGDSAYVDFTITVAADLTPTLGAISGYTARVGSPFSEVLPAATGGDTPLGYTVDDLPVGLSFTEGTRTISGTPANVEAPTVTYTVRDHDGDEASQTFTITVVADLTPTLGAISGYTARVGSPFSEVLPAATSGDGTLSYTATPLPDGLTFDNVSRTIAGTPTTVEAPTVTYTVRDADGDEANQTFTIAVVADLTPTLNAITGYTARVNSQFSQVLPAATGGDTPLGYTVDDLPVGLSFTEGTRTIAGTPTTVEAPTVTYTVRDADGDEANQTFTIAVVADLTPTLNAITGYTARVNSQFSQVLPAATGGDTPLGYTVDDLPVGLSFTEGTRTIAGTPTTVEAPTVTYTVRDDDGDEASQSFTITVEEDLKPTLTTIVGYTARVGSPFSEVLLAATGGDTPLGYTVTNMPTGLSFTESTRTIAGTPTAVESPTVIYTVRDDDGDEASQSFTIAVSADLMPTLEAISDSSAKLTKVFTRQLPVGIGGDGDLAYAVTGLPDGLTFVDSSRTITGRPTVADDFEVAYTATDEDNDEARQTFHIVVYALPTLSEVADVMATKDEVFTLVLTAVSGGKEPFTYTVTGLPTGLSFDKPSLTIIGTPTQIQVADVTFAVEDDDGDTASQEFQISVSEGDTEPTFPYPIPDLSIASG